MLLPVSHADRAASNSHIDWLDYARLLAALGVVAQHYLWRGPIEGWVDYPPAPDWVAQLGPLGIQFFFMISGFVIMLSAPGRSASQFAAARIVRLAPALFACCTLTAVIIALSGAPTSVTFGQWLANLTFMPHWFGFETIDASYWTLQPEIHFYSAVFLVILAGRLAWIEALLYAWLALLVVRFLTGVELPLLSGEFPFFIAGCLLYFGTERGWTTLRLGGVLIAIALGVLYNLAALDIYATKTAALILSAFVPIAMAAAFVAFNRWQPALPYAREISALTYPLYLLHQVAGLIVIRALAPYIGQWLAILVAVTAALGAARLISVYIEARPRRVWRRLANTLVSPVALLETRVIGRKSP